MKHSFFTRTVIAAALMTSLAAEAEFSANVAMTTDYRFRGISQTDEDFAIQGGFDYAHDSGFYAGVWGSNVDFQVQTVDDASAELDIYGGYGGEFGNGIGYDVGILHYEYPNADSSLDYDFTEVYGSLSYKWFTVSYAHTDDYFGGSGDGDYLNLAADVELDGGWGIGGSVGHQSVEENSTWGTPDWNDYKLYVSKEIGGFGLEAAYVDTDLSKRDCWGTDWCESTITFTVSKEF
ncbi:MAG: hypothetical protein EP297_14285 [Gammaproteobacteria bacterium]|nr:MAG: hypothetical protein EP297_14285 [Gammaproteobacteria bacterium]